MTEKKETTPPKKKKLAEYISKSEKKYMTRPMSLA